MMEREESHVDFYLGDRIISSEIRGARHLTQGKGISEEGRSKPSQGCLNAAKGRENIRQMASTERWQTTDKDLAEVNNAYVHCHELTIFMSYFSTALFSKTFMLSITDREVHRMPHAVKSRVFTISSVLQAQKATDLNKE